MRLNPLKVKKMPSGHIVKMVLILSVIILFLTACASAGVPAATATNPAAASPVITPQIAVPTSTILPTPTPDPDDVYYAAEGDEIIKQDWTSGVWTYQTHNLAIEIKRVTTKIDGKRVTYYVADIRTRNGESPYCAPAKEGSGTAREWPYLMSRKSDAVFGITTDYLIVAETNLKGILIRNGKTYHDGAAEDTLAIMPDGSLKIFEKGTVTANDLLAQGIKNSYSFGPTLVENGQINPALSGHRLNRLNPRSSIGMIEAGHYVIVVVDGRDPNHSVGMTLVQLAQVYADLGCKLAYNLDGGESIGMIFMGNSISQHNYEISKGQRKSTDLLAFGVSNQVPGVNDPVINKGNGVDKEVGVTPTPSVTPAPANTTPSVTPSPTPTEPPPSPTAAPTESPS